MTTEPTTAGAMAAGPRPGSPAAWPAAAVRLAGAACVGVVALVLVVVLLLGLLLLPVFGLGRPVVAGALCATRSLAGGCRRVAGRVLGVPLAAAYTSPPGRAWRELLACLRDQQTGRDVVWLLVHGTAGSLVIIGAAALGRSVAIVLGAATTPLAVFTLPVLFAVAVVWFAVPWIDRGFALLARLLLAPADEQLARRVAQLTESRAAAVDAQAAELRRIERDLHDGAQARLVAMSMTLGLTAQAVRTDPEQAATLLDEARADIGRAITELRDLVRGIHPPVLADRGLPGGLEAAALLCPVPVELAADLPGRPPAPVESALYFAATEALANLARHSGATRAWLRAGHDGGVLTVVVGDDGHGGADPRRGSGLRGIQRRLAAFDATLTVDSPPGGPTEIRMEVPCTLSSPRTTSCSATG